MTHGEAETLIVRMSQTWPRTAVSDEWFDFLRDYDAGRAMTAFLKLRGTSKYLPSMAEFADAYGGAGGERRERHACRECDSTGQVYDERGYRFCRCEHGDHMRRLNARLADESDALRPDWLRSV